MDPGARLIYPEHLRMIKRGPIVTLVAGVRMMHGARGVILIPKDPRQSICRCQASRFPAELITAPWMAHLINLLLPLSTNATFVAKASIGQAVSRCISFTNISFCASTNVIRRYTSTATQEISVRT